jgi:RHS repeat-associated protein
MFHPSIKIPGLTCSSISITWENEYPDPPLHWGSAVLYDDNISPPDWQFPGNGVTMADGWIVGSYNALNQPKKMGGLGYQGTANWMWFGYDPLGRCVKRWVSPSEGSAPNGVTYYYYEGWDLIQETAAGSASRYCVHGARVDEVVKQMIQYNPAPRFFHYDARGHCTLQTDASGNIAEQYEYDAFGYPYFYDANGYNIGYSPWGNRFLFTGREWLKDLKLYDYRNRMYQPELGRFMQPDPKEFGAGDYNLYRYCHNDPVNKSDPMGLLEYRFDKDFPEKGPGGRIAIERAIKKELSRTEKGRQILAADGTAFIHRVSPEHPQTGTRYTRDPHVKDFNTYLDPTDSRFQDAGTFRALSRHPGEIPEDSDKGRAVVIGHEFSHGVFKEADEHNGGRNIRDNENAIRRELGLPLRRSDGGVQFRPDE